MAWSLVASAAGAGTTGAIDTSGANLLVVFANGYQSTPTVSDSEGNTWTALQAAANIDPRGRLYYCYNPITSAAHTFTAASGIVPRVTVMAWSGAASSPFDQENGYSSGSSVTTRQPGSVTPTEDGELIITACVIDNNSATLSIDSGFTLQHTAQGSPGNYLGYGFAYLVQTTAAAVNPTWTSSGASGATAPIATFKVASGGGGGTTWLGYVSPFGWR